MSIRTGLAALAVSLSGVAALAGPPSLKNVEEAAETLSLDIRLDAEGNGRVLARLCDHCEELTLRVDAGTRVFVAGAQVPVLEAGKRKDSGATVLFDPQTLTVTRIVFWR